LNDVLQKLSFEAQEKMGQIPRNYDRRHTFVVGAWEQDISSIYVVSNYEEANTEKVESKASDSFIVSKVLYEPGGEVRILVTGATTDIDAQDCIRLLQVAKKPGAAGVDIKNLCAKAISNASGRRKNKGTIGSSVLWAIAEKYQDVQGGLDVVGGTTVQTMPNAIMPNIQIKDIRIETPRAKPITWGQPFPLPENHCQKCGNPVPLGYQRCGVCGNDIQK
jgi:hypothetical protein